MITLLIHCNLYISILY